MIKHFNEPAPLDEVAAEMRKAGGSIVVAGRRVTGEVMLREWLGHLGWSNDGEVAPAAVAIDDEYSRMKGPELRATAAELGLPDFPKIYANAKIAQAIRDHLNQ